MSNIALLAGAALSLWWVDPYGDKPYLPDAEPHGGIETNLLACSAAQGEIESLSFCVRPVRDMRKVDFKPSDMSGPDGAVIPASCSDFALVKVWYRADSRWVNSWQGNIWAPTLVPNLIIHDDDLVHVVEAEEPTNRTVLVRISYPEGNAYVDMRKHGGKGSKFNHSLHPIIDAPSFVPFDLKAGKFQQYWLTWKVPADAKPGMYRGKLSVSEDGAHLADIPLELEVYPFTLPKARTHYDTSQPYLSMWMGMPTLEKLLENSKRLDVAERKLRAIYRSCAEHNAHCQGPGKFKEDSTQDLAVRTLVMMLQEGMTCDLFVNDSAFQSPYLAAMNDDYKSPEEDPERFISCTNAFAKKIAVAASVMDRYLGHRNCYFHSLDECATYFNRLSYPFWGMLHEAGFKAWTDMAKQEDISWSVDMNDTPSHGGRHEDNWEWHRAGAKTVSYAAPFTGPIDPDIWRRTKGLRYYYADMDGLYEYCFDCAENAWNDFTHRSPYSQFQFVYLTYDGLVTTLPWEAVREALDDVRYLSLLRLRAEAAMRSPDERIRALGRRHFAWMDSQDPELIIDLFAFRREVARRINELIAAVGPEPPEKGPAIPPPLPPLEDDAAPPPAPAERIARAEELEKKNRYDLAIPVWDSQRTDTALQPEVRADAAMEEARLMSAMLRRDDAVRVLDETIALPDVKNVQRTKLRLLRAKLLTTPRIYEEEFTKEQLDAAAASLEVALKSSGADEEERYGAAYRLARAYLAGYAPKEAIAFVEKCFADMKLSGREHKRDMHLVMANAYYMLSDWDNCAAMYRMAHADAIIRNREEVKREGEVAEKRKDWKTAVRAYGDESKMYSDEEKKEREHCIKRLAKVMEKLQAEQRKADMTPIEDVGEPLLNLDE